MTDYTKMSSSPTSIKIHDGIWKPENKLVTCNYCRRFIWLLKTDGACDGCGAPLPVPGEEEKPVPKVAKLDEPDPSLEEVLSAFENWPEPPPLEKVQRQPPSLISFLKRIIGNAKKDHNS